MRYIHQHIGIILQMYKGDMPLANFLKFYFKKHPVLGSRDRKMLSEMAYCYYRCAKGLLPKGLSNAEKTDASLLLAESHLAPIEKILPEQLRSFYGQDFETNLTLLNKQGIDFDLNALFEKDIPFSDGITMEDWLHSMLHRPKLFIRVVPKYYTQVKELLSAASLSFVELEDYCISLANGSPVEKILSEKMYRTQDASSQKTARYFRVKDRESCWDCCSGAGGKSLLVKDIAPNAPLCVSDVRKSILDNLAERFQLYGYAIPERLLLSVADTEQTKAVLGNRSFEHIIADVPCSGSGTWARTPEQLYFFDHNTLIDFSERQKNIAQNAVQYLSAGGSFVYITCSVFRQENEDVVAYILEKNPGLKLLEQKLINGLKMGADSMFVAVLERT
jgi:16S rRNA (cytosine967-C5)-methyltransferase